ncbi:unnamed protein product [Dicrocoelium dendriticum]|nr:unnamed protein product [Dicrocoelium dendriticum]
MVYLLGHPNQALLDITFSDVPRKVNERELAKQLSELFDNVTEKCKDQRGPVVGKVQLEDFRFLVSVFENGHFSGWPSAYDKPEVLKTIESILCYEVTSFAQEDNLMRNSRVNCMFIRPIRSRPSGYFRAQFQGHTALDQGKVIDELRRTNATEEVTYYIDPFQYRFQQHNLTNASSELVIGSEIGGTSDRNASPYTRDCCFS